MKVTLPAGQLDHTEKITVTNTGHSAFDVTSGTALVGSSCKVAAAPSWVKITPAHFTLQPGQHKVAHVAVNAPAGTNASLLAVFTATGKAAGNARVSGAAAARLVVHSGASSTAACQHPPVAAARPGAGGIAMALLIAVAIFAVTFVPLLAWFRRRRRGSHRSF